jgi:hypothetical protein
MVAHLVVYKRGGVRQAIYRPGLQYAYLLQARPCSPGKQRAFRERQLSQAAAVRGAGHTKGGLAVMMVGRELLAWSVAVLALAPSPVSIRQRTGSRRKQW